MAVFEFRLFTQSELYGSVRANTYEEADDFLRNNFVDILDNFGDFEDYVDIGKNEAMRDCDAMFDASKEYLAVNVKEV